MADIAILGFGVVGSGVLEVIEKNYESIASKTKEPVNVKKILDIRDFSEHKYAKLFTKNYEDILNDDSISVVVEVIGGVEPAYTFTKQAFEHGKSVVTSNKELVAKKGAELLEIAKKNGLHYMFEASVGGGIPIIRPLNKCLSANEISEVMGILNGTTNYILTQMIKKGQSFEDALSQAQKNGYAERNPSADIDGIDACRKISILMDIVTGYEVDSEKVYTEGITKISLSDIKYTDSMDCVVKLIGLGRVCGEKVFVRVSPLIIPKSNVLSNVEDVFNGISVVGDATGEVMFYGKGAGKLPTASAVVADVMDEVKHKGKPAMYEWEKTENDGFMIDINDTSSKFFVRAKNITSQQINECFDNCTILELSIDGETAFVTKETNEKAFKDMAEKLKNSGVDIISVIRKID